MHELRSLKFIQDKVPLNETQTRRILTLESVLKRHKDANTRTQDPLDLQSPVLERMKIRTKGKSYVKSAAGGTKDLKLGPRHD